MLLRRSARRQPEIGTGPGDDLGEGSPGLTDDPTDSDGQPLETLTGGVVDPRLDMFRDFVNSLDTDPGGESRTG